MTLHRTLMANRWTSLSLAEQLGNVGSEFLRTRQWAERGDEVRRRAAFDRFLELMDATVADTRWSGLRKRELTKLREQTTKALTGHPSYLPDNLQKYFDQFAFLARNTH